MIRLRYLPDVVTLALDGEKCTGCETCVTVCPHAVFRLDNGKAQIVDRNACMECGACQRNCPAAAVSVEAGVGCAAAVIRGKLGPGKSSDGCCSIDSPCPDRRPAGPCADRVDPPDVSIEH